MKTIKELLHEDEENWKKKHDDDDGDENPFSHHESNPNALHVVNPNDVDELFHHVENGIEGPHTYYGHESVASGMKHFGHRYKDSGERAVMVSKFAPFKTPVDVSLLSHVDGPEKYWTHGPGTIEYMGSHEHPHTGEMAHYFYHTPEGED